MVFINESINENVLFAVKASQEYNTKLILLGLLLAYSIGFLLLRKWLLSKEKHWSNLAAKASTIVASVTLFFYPLLLIFMYLEVELDRMFFYLGIMYSVIFVLVLIVGYLYFFEMMGDIIRGFGFDIPKVFNKKRRSKRL